MVNLVALILRIIHQLLKLFAEKMYLPKIQWSEVSEEGLINQIIIDAEVESVLA